MRIDALRLLTSARLVVIATDATVRTAASALSNPQIGLIVVCDEKGRAAGVVSKSDLVRHLASMGVAEAPRFHADEPEHHLLPPRGRSPRDLAKDGSAKPSEYTLAQH